MLKKHRSPPLSYQGAGVDTLQAEQLVTRIQQLAQTTRRPELLSGIGGFASLCALPSGYKSPVLVSCTDGVGTKLCLAKKHSDFVCLGQDLVAMCVNDLAVTGAEPLLFQDYYACGELNTERAEALIEGVALACQVSGCSLAGGETAEMPGVYPKMGFDLAGFSLGVVEKDQVIDGHSILPGDLVIGLPSNGLHANGFSLVRQVLQTQQPLCSAEAEKLHSELMKPTKLYPQIIRALHQVTPIKGVAHITGGGLAANFARILPPEVRAQLDLRRWTRQPIFHWLHQQGPITIDEMLSTFNCGLGMLCVIAPKQLTEFRNQLAEQGEDSFVVGEILAANEESPAVTLTNTDAF